MPLGCSKPSPASWAVLASSAKGTWLCLRNATGTHNCSKNEMSQEGPCLSISCCIIQGMEGKVQYGKAFGYAEFVVRVALASLY